MDNPSSFLPFSSLEYGQLRVEMVDGEPWFIATVGTRLIRSQPSPDSRRSYGFQGPVDGPEKPIPLGVNLQTAKTSNH